MRQVLKILMLEDLPSDAMLVRRHLEKSKIKFESKLVYKREDFILALDEFLPDIVLSDHQLPQFNSFEALEILKQKKTNIPFILVTGTVSEEFAVTIIEMGADNYILKNNLSRLPNAIKSALHKKQIEKEREDYQRQLENKINEINTFIYRISHDLKAPIASTFGIIQLVRKKIVNNPALEYFDLIEKSNKKMENILLGFAEVVKISQGSIVEEKFNLLELVQDVIQNLKNIPAAKGIRFNISIDKNLEFSGSKSIMVSILQNLVHNSIIYRREISDSYISIGIIEKEKFIEMEISDNGTGIEPSLQPKVFEMFYRATISSTGSGLGLYIVKNAIEKIGGTITLNSTAGIGTTFKISLPKK